MDNDGAGGDNNGDGRGDKDTKASGLRRSLQTHVTG